MPEETFGTQSEIWLKELETRKRKPVSPSTLDTYRKHVRRLSKFVSVDEPLVGIHNGRVRDIAAKMSSLGAKTIHETLATLRAIVGSAVNPETGNVLYPRAWNHKFIDAPEIGKQKQPAVSAKQVEDAIKGATSWQQILLYAILAGTGLRISECLAIRIRSVANDQTAWLPDQSLIRVRSTIFEGAELRDHTKTQSAKRDVDLYSKLNEAIQTYVEANKIQSGQFLFQANENDEALEAETLRFKLTSRGIPGFHAFRRFRISHLRSVPVLSDLISYWAGHAAETITDLYSKLGENLELRQSWAARAGLGFSLENVEAPPPKNKPKPVVKPNINKRKENAKLRSIAAATRKDEARRAALITEVVSPTLNDLEKARAVFESLGGRL